MATELALRNFSGGGAPDFSYTKKPLCELCASNEPSLEGEWAVKTIPERRMI
jgi:hypothetical protein